MLGLIIAGLASSFVFIPPYKEMELCLDVYKPRKNFHPERVQDMVSGVYNSGYAFGGVLGPVYGGYTQKLVGFKATSDI